ncbi:MAG: hypothetical protein M1308_06010 [Actinobacteria bacterium]|nr:hypothetical protein [Actinomycetota bacterium]
MTVKEMTSRERLKRTLERKEVDRVPLDIGSTINTGINTQAYEKLVSYLGMKNKSERCSAVWSLATPEESLLKRLSVDTRGIFAPTPNIYKNQSTNPDEIIDEWGLIYKKPQGCIYYELKENPFAKADIDDLEKYLWPDPEHPERIAGIKDVAKKLHEDGGYAIVGNPSGGTSIFERSWYFRGLEQFLVDLIVNKKFAHTLLEIILDIQTRKWKLLLSEIGQYLDVIAIGDDLAGQTNLLMSPGLYREMIKPYQKKIFQSIKQWTDAKLFYHSCGNISPILGDLIEAGIDIINPVQVSAQDMAPERLKKEFGNKVTFWGAVDTHDLLNRAEPEEVIIETKKLISILGQDGGYVVAANHNIQPDVKPQNILAMISAVLAKN